MTTPSAQSRIAAQPSSTGDIPIHGRFLWHALLARDMDAALRFYPAVTGWTVQRMEVPGAGEPYTMFLWEGRGIAGVQPYPAAQLETGAQPLWLPYVGTSDTDATCREAVALGGTQLMAPWTIPTVGRIGVLRDPQGAQFAVIAPEPAGMPEVTPDVGEFAWHEMMADEPVSLLEFYRKLFGWELKHSMDMGSHGVYQMFGRGEFVYGGFMRRSPETPSTFWNCYVRVADLDAAIDAVKANGGTLVMGPHEVPNDDRVAVAIDNQGAVVSLVSRIRR